MTRQQQIDRLYKPVLFVVCLAPFLQVVAGAFNAAGQRLSVNAIETLLHTLGLWGLTFLVLDTARHASPDILGKPWLVSFRRMLGLYAFFYVLMHFLTWLILDQDFYLAGIAEDIAKRPFITIGFLVSLMLIPLAVTSTNAMMRKLGKRWKRLQPLTGTCRYSSGPASRPEYTERRASSSVTRMKHNNVIRLRSRSPEHSQSAIHDRRDSETQCLVETTAAARLNVVFAETGPALTFIGAPPGFGKTVLLTRLRQKLESRGLNVRCLDLDVCKEFDPGALNQNVDHRGSISFVLVDNFDRLELANAAEKLSDCLNSKQVRYVIASRTIPQMDWLTPYLGKKALLLRARDLQMSGEEIRQGLELYSGRPVPTSILSQVARVTEGWPIAICACGRFARDLDSWHEALDRISRTDEDLPWYLHDVVLKKLTPAMISFLVGVASFERFSAALCEYALVDLEGALYFDEAIRANLFILPAAEEGWFRLHPTFRKALQRTAKASRSVERARLTRAFEWCISHDRACEAAAYAMRIEDFAGVEQALLRVTPADLYARSELASVASWVQEIEHRKKRVPFWLRILKVWSLTYGGPVVEVGKDVDALGHLLERTSVGDKKGIPSYLLDHLHCMIALKRDRVSEVFGRATAWLRQYEDVPAFYRATVIGTLATSNFMRMQEAEFRRNLDLAKQIAYEAGSQLLATRLCALEALAEVAYGKTMVALRIVEQEVNHAQNMSGGEIPAAAWTLNLAAARVLCELGNEDAAESYLVAGSDNLEASPLVIATANLESVVAIAEKKGSVSTALAEAREFASQRTLGGRFMLEAARVVTLLLLRSGDVVSAECEFHSKLKTSVSGDAADMRPEEDLSRHSRMFVEAALLVAKGQAEEALKACKKALQEAEAHGRVRRVVELSFLKAAALRKLGKVSMAARVFSRAFELAAQRELFLATHDLGWAIHPFLTMRAFSPRCEDFAQRVLNRLHLGPPPVEDVAAGPDSLTRRELEVLALLDSGLTNEMVGARLSLSVTTVKWHLKNIYAKLGVANRSGALAKIRPLGLLESQLNS